MSEANDAYVALESADDNYADAYFSLHKWVDLGGLGYLHEGVEEEINSLPTPTPDITEGEKKMLTDLMTELKSHLEEAEFLVTCLRLAAAGVSQTDSPTTNAALI